MGTAWLYAGFPALIDNGFGERFEELARLHPPGSSDVTQASTRTHVHTNHEYCLLLCCIPTGDRVVLEFEKVVVSNNAGDRLKILLRS